MEQDDKIFIYLQLQDEKETLLKSRIREFAALGKLLADFIRECWEVFEQPLLKIGRLEYVDANTDMVLISFRYDIIRCRLIISGLIPPKYQKRMLDPDEARLKLSNNEFIQRIASNLTPMQKAALQQHIQYPPYNVLSLIKANIDENGEYYITLDVNPGSFKNKWGQ